MLKSYYKNLLSDINIIVLILILTISSNLIAEAGTVNLKLNSIKKVISKMTLEEKASLLVGGEEYIRGYPAVFGGTDSLFGKLPTGVGDTRQYVQGAAGYTYAFERLGITPMVFADGPAGVRIDPVRQNDSNTYYTTAFPIATLLASSWNNDLVYSVGKAMGNEALEYGIDILLAPALNIQRNPLGGRNFEYYSEDPILSGKIAAYIVNGIQSNGVGACIKHFAANNNETNRLNIDNKMDEKSLHEIYLRGFEIALKESKPWAVMSAYNKINGVYCSENNWLLTDYLRKEIGFKGLVMSDWFAGRDYIQQVIAGNDILMPGSKYIIGKIVEAVENKKLNEKFIDRNIEAILSIVLQTPRFREYKFSNKPDLETHKKVAREAAVEGMVLLKNASESLPFSDSIKKVALFGNASYHTISGGSGSGDVNKKYNSDICVALKNSGYLTDIEIEDDYIDYLKFAKDTLKPAGWMKRENTIAEFCPKQSGIEQSAITNDCAIFTISRRSGEFNDRLLSSFSLNNNEISLLKSISEQYHSKGKKVIVLLNIGAPIEVNSWSDFADAILLIWQPGQEGGNALCDILKGDVTPSGKLTSTFPLTYSDLPNAHSFPAVLPEKTKIAEYNEGEFFGYRYFTTFDKPVSYPFGFGLSYTQFTYSNPGVTESESEYCFKVDVTNTGNYNGKEVVQLYVKSPKGNINSSSIELKGFGKTKELKPGETETLEIKVKKSYLTYYLPESKKMTLENGEYYCYFSSSVADRKMFIKFQVNNMLNN